MEIDLVFGGGGAKGIVHCGALHALESRGYQPGRLIGTSAGAITAILLAAGYDAAGIHAVFNERRQDGNLRLQSLLDVPPEFPEEFLQSSRTRSSLVGLKIPLLPDEKREQMEEKIFKSLIAREKFRQLFSLVELGGLYAGDYFVRWMQEKLDLDGRGLGSATLSELHARTGSHFTAVATDLDDQARLVLNHITAPDVPVVWAVRMSMSIPLVWREVIWEPEWGLYGSRSLAGHSIVDGGVTSNLALDLGLAEIPEIVDVMGGKSSTPVCIGLSVDSTLPVPGTAEAREPSLLEENRHLLPGHLALVERRLSRLLDTLTKNHDVILRQMYPDTICYLPAGGYETMEFDMSDERMQCLVDGGKQAMLAYLDAHGILP